MVYADNEDLWTTVGFWVGLILWLCWTVFAMFLQVTLSPKIYRWAEALPGSDPDTDPPIKDKKFGFGLDNFLGYLAGTANENLIDLF